MSKSVKRNKLLTDKQIKIYCNLEFNGKSKRIRKKALKILEHDRRSRWNGKEWGTEPFI